MKILSLLKKLWMKIKKFIFSKIKTIEIKIKISTIRFINDKIAVIA